MAHVSMADSFIEAMADLDAGDARRTAAFLDKLIREPDASGLHVEQIHDAGDREIRSMRVSQDLRAVGCLDGDRWLLLYVAHHDKAYAWARDRCVTCHPVTGVLQVVTSPHRADAALATWEQRPVPSLFDAVTDDYLLSLGLPPEWLPTIRQVRSDEMLLAIVGDLPPSIGDRLLRVASGELVDPEAEEEWVCEVDDHQGLCRVLDSRHIPHNHVH